MITVYPAYGRYQLKCYSMSEDGEGAASAALEALKAKLLDEGIFSQKRERPMFPKKIAVITSPTGAAVQDIKNVISRRYPVTELCVIPAYVQGANAVPSLIAGLNSANAVGADLIIFGRGGGSIEDLWAFNEKAVAQAVFDCSVPIISAVGHETDTTIIDYVSDLRAPTPSAAAELAVTDVKEIDNMLTEYENTLQMQLQRVLRAKRERCRYYEMQLKYLSPESRIRERKMRSMQLEERLLEKMQTLLRKKRHELALYIEKMKGLSPLEKLNSGFSYVEDSEGRNIRSVSQVEAGQELSIRVRDGVIATKVKEIIKGESI